MTVTARQRPWVGWSISGIAVIHLLTAAAFYGPSLQSIWAGGVINAVEADPGSQLLQSVGFWYLASGLATLSLGLVVTWLQRRLCEVPTMLGWLLLGITVFGVVLMPASAFWVFLVPATLAFLQARRFTRDRAANLVSASRR